MHEKILFVDDDENLLNSYKRQLRKQFQLETANGPQRALELTKDNGPFAVIVSDMRMPGMNGIEFLGRVRELYPDSVRMMLTGNADLQTAIDAVNQGCIFRFLNKPCPPEMMVETLQAALAQYRLIHSEKELLEKTLRGSIKVLTEILSLVNPTAFSCTARIKQYVKHMARELQLPDPWQYEIAAMLSQVGCVTLPQLIINKIYRRRDLSYAENKMFKAHPKVAQKLLERIPRLDLVSRMIENQLKPFEEYTGSEHWSQQDRLAAVGSQMLRIAMDYDQLVARAISPHASLNALRKRPGQYNPALLDALETLELDQVEVEIREITVEEMEIGMVTDEHIKSKKGVLLVPLGHEVTYPVLERVRNFHQGRVGIKEPFRVRIPCPDYFD
ncbi:MAG: response regulator [Sedimentisphaerales bacterium]|nr:response regulator [Sedimentisphaerales bacterium]